MLKNTLKIACFTWVILNATTVFAEVELIHQDQIFSDQDSLTVKTHGSMRLQALNFDEYNANNQSQKYRRNGYSAASRMYLDLDYKLNENTHLIVGYQNYFNLPKSWIGMVIMPRMMKSSQRFKPMWVWKILNMAH